MANALLLEPQMPAAITVSSTATGYDSAFMSRDEMGLVWRSNGGASAGMVIDLGADLPVDTIILLGVAGAQAGWTWVVELATAAQGPFSSTWWTGATETLLAGSAMPVSGLGKALWRAPGGAPAIARYLRLTVNGLGGAALEVSRLLAGKAVQLDRNFKFGAALGVRPLGSLDFSARGVLLRRKGKKLRGVGISFPSVYRDEVEAKVQPLLERVGNDGSLAIVLDPAPDAQRQNRIWFGFLTGDLGSTWARAGGFQADFNLVAID